MKEEASILSFEEIMRTKNKPAMYGRVSTDDQEEDMQVYSVKNLLKAYGKELTKDCIYIDPATSAFKVPAEKRKKLEELKVDAAAGKFDFVVIYKNDRLARNTLEHNEFRKYMNELKPPIPIVISSSKEVYTSGEIIPLTVKDGMTRMESMLISERTTDTLATIVKDGKWKGGKPPYGFGYNQEEKRLFIKEDEIENVKKIFSLFKMGKGFTKISAQIGGEIEDEDKIKDEEKWYREKVKAIIINPIYAGYLAIDRFDNGKLKMDISTWKWSASALSDFVPIMTREEWEYCFQLYVKKSQENSHLKPRTPFLLRDILYCEKCNTQFLTKDQRSAKNNKEGKKVIYGKQIYYCKHCQTQLKIEDVHEAMRKHLMPRIKKEALIKEDELIKRVKERIENENMILNKKDKALEEEIKNKEWALSEMDRKISQMYRNVEIGKVAAGDKKEELKKVADIIDILLIERSKKFQKLDKTKQAKLEIEIEKEKSLNSALQETQEVSKLIKSLIENKEEIPRQLLLQFVKRIFISETLEMNYQLYADLS